MTRFVIFGVLGPAASYLSFCLLSGWVAGLSGLPLAYAIEVVPFLLCALIDRSLENVRSWERVIVVGIAGFFTSAVAMPLAASVFFPRVGLGIMILGLLATIPAAVCSVLTIATKVPDDS